MRKTLKKWLSFLMVCTICMGSVLTVSAQSAPSFLQQEDIEKLSQLVSYYLDDKNIVTNSVSVGGVIPTYQVKGADISNVEHVEYYPVFLDHEVLGIFTVMMNNGKKTYSFGEDFSDFLNHDFYSKDICILFKDGKTIISGDEKNIVVEDIDKTSVGNTVEVLLPARENIQRKNIFEEPVNSIKNSRAVTGKVTIYIDIKNQYSSTDTSNLCWAFSVCHIGDTVTSVTGVTPRAIAQDYWKSTSPSVYNYGVYTDKIPGIFSKHYDLDTTYKTSPLTFSKVKANINADKPIYTDWQSKNNGHAMVLLGYGDNNAICLGDSNIGNWKWLLPSTSDGTDWTYTYNGGEPHKWDATVTID